MVDNLGLIVDAPKSGDSGSSNDESTTQRTFINHEMASEILGIHPKAFYCFLFYVL